MSTKRRKESFSLVAYVCEDVELKGELVQDSRGKSRNVSSGTGWSPRAGVTPVWHQVGRSGDEYFSKTQMFTSVLLTKYTDSMNHKHGHIEILAQDFVTIVL